MEKVVIGNAELYLGDCLEIMPTLGKVDALISDPPYGIGWDGNATRFKGGSVTNTNHGTIINDDVPFDPSHLLDFQRVVLWGYPCFAAKLPVGNTLIWDKRFKNGSAFLADAEIGWCKSQYKNVGPKTGGYGSYIFSQTWQGFVRSEPVEHPTQKPVALMRWCMEKAKVPEGGTVLDPYCGSGTTGVACMEKGFNFIGIEIDPKHFETACKRISAAQQQGQLGL